MIDYFDDYGLIDNNKVINAVKEVNEKLSKEKDGNKRTQLMMEQLLRGLYLGQDFQYYR